MVKRRERPPRTDDLVELGRLSALQFDEETLASIAELSPYYSISRYLNTDLWRPWEEIGRKTARGLVDEARGLWSGSALNSLPHDSLKGSGRHR